MITAENIRKRFGRNVVLDQLDFAPTPGRVTVLLGRNGCGKSTFLKLCLGVLRADEGTLVAPPRNQIGYVPDKPDCYDWMTPNDLFRFLKPQYPTWNDDKVVRASESLNVPMDRKFGALSRGEGMKAMLVAALAHEPELLLLDEPFAGLDPVVREDVLRGIIAELRDDERTVLCATHDLDVAARIADRITVLQDGKIVKHGDLEDVLGGDDEIGRVPDRMRMLLTEVA